MTKVENSLLATTFPPTAGYPNSQTPCFGLYNKGFNATLTHGGIYRMGIKGICGDDPKYWPYWRMFYSTWDINNDPAYWHFQITGTIKDVAQPEEIPPHS